jgi:hypothetical protein
MGMEYEIYGIYSNEPIAWYKQGRPDIGILGNPSGYEKEYLAAKKKYFRE